MLSKTKILVSLTIGIVAFCCFKAMGLLGAGLAGAGHGTAVLGYLFLSPIYNGKGDIFICFGPYIWATVGFCCLWASRWYITVLMIALIGVCYFGAFKDIMDELQGGGSTQYIYRIFERVPVLSFSLVLAYTVMQLTVVYVIIVSRPFRATN